MSFFIKGKKKKEIKHIKKRKVSENSRASSKKKRKNDSDDEVSSDFDDIEINNEYTYSSEDDGHETVQEKKLRLAKKYLDEIESEERKRLDGDEVTKEVISDRLKEEELAQLGKLRRKVADEIIEFDPPCVLRCKEHSRNVTCLVVSPDNNYIFSASDDFNIVKWSLINLKKSGVVRRTDEKGLKKKVLALAVSQKFLASGDADAKINLWSCCDLTHVHTFTGHKIDVTGLTFQKGTHQLFSSSSDKTVKIWNLDEMMYVETLYGHQAGVTSIDCLARERLVTSGGRDNSLRIWKIVEESHLVLNGHKDALDCVRLIDENHMVSGGEDGFVCLWSSLKKKPLHMLADAHGPGSWIVSIATCPYSDIFATGSFNGVIQIYRIDEKVKSFTLLLTVPVEGCVNALDFTSDGKKLVAAIGKEHKLGRWITFKSAKNSVVVIPFKLKNE